MSDLRRRLARSERDFPWDVRPHTHHTLGHLRDRLDEALSLTEGMLLLEAAECADLETSKACGCGEVVREEFMGKLAQTWEMVEGIQHGLPPVECWCVVKVYYRDGKEESRTVWTGHTDREQAEAFAPAIAAHYAAKNHHTSDSYPDHPGFWGGHSDRFIVGRAAANVRDVIGPECSPQEYVRGLGS